MDTGSKLQHFVAGMGISLTFLVFGSPILGLYVNALAAAGKEVYDYFHPETHTCDVMDMLMTILDGMLMRMMF